jgi:hypothetical protein
MGTTQPPIQWVPGALSPGVKRQGREVDHTPSTSAEVEKTWIYTSTPPRLRGVVAPILYVTYSVVESSLHKQNFKLNPIPRGTMLQTGR